MYHFCECLSAQTAIFMTDYLVFRSNQIIYDIPVYLGTFSVSRIKNLQLRKSMQSIVVVQVPALILLFHSNPIAKKLYSEIYLAKSYATNVNIFSVLKVRN